MDAPERLGRILKRVDLGIYEGTGAPIEVRYVRRTHSPAIEFYTLSDAPKLVGQIPLPVDEEGREPLTGFELEMLQEVLERAYDGRAPPDLTDIFGTVYEALQSIDENRQREREEGILPEEDEAPSAGVGRTYPSSIDAADPLELLILGEHLEAHPFPGAEPDEEMPEPLLTPDPEDVPWRIRDARNNGYEDRAGLNNRALRHKRRW